MEMLEFLKDSDDAYEHDGDEATLILGDNSVLESSRNSASREGPTFPNSFRLKLRAKQDADEGGGGGAAYAGGDVTERDGKVEDFKETEEAGGDVTERDGKVEDFKETKGGGGAE